MSTAAVTVGRIVHYHEDGVPPRAAIIVAVNVGVVDLAVFQPGHYDFRPLRNVSFSEGIRHGCWSWPPRDPPPITQAEADRHGGGS